MLRIGLLASGCGALDGTDPVQLVLWRCVAARREHVVMPIAPDVPQHDVVGAHGPVAGERRRVHDEVRRLTDGLVEDAAAVRPDEIDLLVVPGGMGAVKTLCTAAVAEPVTCLDAPAALARGVVDRGGVVVVVDEACVWAAYALDATTAERIASDGRTAIDEDLRRAGRTPVSGRVDPVVDGAVISHWMDAGSDPSAILDATASLLDVAEATLGQRAASGRPSGSTSRPDA